MLFVQKYRTRTTGAGSGPWSDLIHAANRVHRGTFGVPEHVRPYWSGGTVECHRHVQVIRVPGESVTVTSTSPTGVEILQRAADELVTQRRRQPCTARAFEDVVALDDRVLLAELRRLAAIAHDARTYGERQSHGYVYDEVARRFPRAVRAATRCCAAALRGRGVRLDFVALVLEAARA